MSFGSHFNSRRWRHAAAGVVLVAGAMAAAAPVLAQEGAPPEEQVQVIGTDLDGIVATVDGEPITERDLLMMGNLLGADTLNQFPVDAWRGILLEQVIATRVVVRSAEELGLDQQPDFVAAMEDYRNQALQQQYVAAVVEPMVTEEDVRAEYELRVAALDLPLEVTARVIVVETEVEANDVLRRLAAGEDFADLAVELSLDRTTGENGGLLGDFLTRDEFVAQDLADVAFDAEPGEVYPVPIAFEGFWHILKVDERRQRPPPPYDDSVRSALQQQLIGRAFNAAVDELLASAEVEVIAEDPVMVPEGDEEAPAPDADAPAAEVPAEEAPADPDGAAAPAGP